MLHKIELSVSGAGVAEFACRMLSGWGYFCSIHADAAVQRVAAKGDEELSSERFQQLIAAITALGGALYGCRMLQQPDDRPSPLRQRAR